MRKAEPVVVACIPAYNEERTIGGVNVVHVWRAIVMNSVDVTFGGCRERMLFRDLLLSQFDELKNSLKLLGGYDNNL